MSISYLVKENQLGLEFIYRTVFVFIILNLYIVWVMVTEHKSLPKPRIMLIIKSGAKSDTF